MTKDKEFGIRFNTRHSLEEVENWIAEHCSGDWDVRLSEIIEDTRGQLWKRLEIRFASPEDRARFREHYLPDVKKGAAGSKNSTGRSATEREFV